MVIVWYNCKDNVSVVLSAKPLYSLISIDGSYCKTTVFLSEDYVQLRSSSQLQEIDDMQAKIVIYLRMFIRLSISTIFERCFLSTLPWC